MTTSTASPSALQTLHWEGGVDGYLVLIDQTLLPTEFREIACRTVETVWEAIKSLRVRGAPAIGVAAAYGVCVGVQTAASADEAGLYRRLNEVLVYLATSRPTAVNLFWALDRMRRVAESVRGKLSPRDVAIRLIQEAKSIEEEDRRTCRDLGRYGAALLSDGQECSPIAMPGGLWRQPTTARRLAVIFAATEGGRRVHVCVDETPPPCCKGALGSPRVELKQRNIPAGLRSAIRWRRRSCAKVVSRR